MDISITLAENSWTEMPRCLKSVFKNVQKLYETTKYLLQTSWNSENEL